VFPIVQVDPTSNVGDEQLGSKSKFWYDDDQGDRWLFKYAREITPGGELTGEDWGEKLGAEIASAIRIPAARVELAECQGRRGSSSKRFLSSERESLVHGNEVLAGMIIGYDRNKRLHQQDHTLDNIVLAFQKFLGRHHELGTGILQQLAEYFVLDALIGNTDRHHENWGIVFNVEGTTASASLKAAPSFDHASSLGRELPDTKRLQILEQGRIDSYVRGGRGGIYIRNSDKKGANPLELVQYALQKYPELFRQALVKVAGAEVEMLCSLVDAVPSSRMTAAGRQFAKEFLRCTHQKLRQL
jgi:HipA-like C-terminal domain